MTEYRWISDEDCYLAINCPHCGGKTEALKVEPSRSSFLPQQDSALHPMQAVHARRMNYTVVDIETTGRSAHTDRLLCVGIGERVYTADDGRKMARLLMLRPGTVIVAHTNYDLRWLMLEGAELGRNVHYHDTKVMAWLLDGTQPLDLESLTEKYCGYVPDKRLRQVANRVMFRRDDGEYVPIEDTPQDELFSYNLSDLRAEAALYEALRTELQRRGLWHHFLAEEAPFSRLLIEIEAAGMPFDRERAVEQLAASEAKQEELRRSLVALTGAPNFNPGSAEQVARFLYTEAWTQPIRFDIPRMNGVPKDEKLELAQQLAPKGVRVDKVGRDYAYGTLLLDGMGLRPPKRTKKQKTTRPSVSGKKLAILHGSNPWVAEYIEWKKLDKLNGYLRDWIARCHEGRLYGRFDQSGTATGRLAAREPNLQQVATESDVRDLFRGELVVGDYSGLEVRLSAHFSLDPVMLEIFESGADLYGTLASEAWGGPASKENELRPTMKVVMLGSQYGAAGETLAEVMALAGIPTTATEASRFLSDLKRTLPRLFEWREEVIAQAKKDGYVTTLAGRRRQIANINSAAWEKVGRAERQAVNTTVQGSAADVVRRAMLAARKAIDPSVARMILQVHDEIIWNRGREWDDAAFPHLVDICQYGHGFELNVPLIFDAKVATSWADKGGDAGVHAIHEHLNNDLEEVGA